MRRRKAERQGRRAERVAALWLQATGHRILARRLRMPAMEIDLLVRHRKCVIAVEVKRRVTRDEALNALARTDWARLALALEQATALPVVSRMQRPISLRLDAVVTAPGQWPLHKRDVWRRF